MKVLYVYKDYYPVVGGIENHLRLICRGLRAYPDIEPAVLVTNTSGRTVTEEIDGVRVIKAARLANVSSAPISLELFAWVRRLEADITHLHFPYPIGEMAYLLAGRSRKMVITYHSDIVRQKYLLQVYKPFMYRVLARADRITVSNPTYISSSPYLRPLAGKCVVIPHGADLDRFAASHAVTARAEEIRRTYGSPLILFVGLLRYYKGLAYLIEAMEQIEGRLLVVGQGPQGEEWRALSRQRGLEHKVVFLGRVSDEELVALYHACDVFVLPSIHRSESWGAVQVEAMACGKPVVCTELGTGTSFVNLNGVTGLVVPPQDAGALAGAVNQLLANPDLRRRLGEAGCARAQSELSAAVMVERLVKMYRQVVKDA
ncbi:MAG: glycosyltransferase [Thermoflexales bacterium]|nr:glycosyltransferase [Thermoflexales bacterium]